MIKILKLSKECTATWMGIRAFSETWKDQGILNLI